MKLGQSVRRRRSASVAGLGAVFMRSLAIALGMALGGWLVGYGVATKLIFPRPQLPTTLVSVPDLRGETPEGARGELEAQGLQLAGVDPIRHPLIDSGRVVGQAPLPGQLALPGDSVRVAVSLGPDRRPVPDLSRLRGQRVVDLLEATGFTVTVDSVESMLPRGGVVQVVPAMGTQVALPGSVQLTISLGPPVVTMPDLVGLDIGVAEDSVASLGLVVGAVDEVFRFGRDQGRVVEQSPAPETRVRRGGAVRLVMGRRGG